MRFSATVHFFVFLIAAVVIGLRVGSVLDYAAWRSGTAFVMGNVGEIEASRQIRIVRYSYEVGGESYTGEAATRTGFVENTPVRVTYAKSNPDVSSIQPERMDGIYRVSLILCALAGGALLVVWVMELVHALRRKPTGDTES